MFTSRAEHRLTLRTSNADFRLTPLGHELGLVKDADWQRFLARRQRLEQLTAALHGTIVKPDKATVELVETWGGGTLIQPTTLAQLLCRPEVTLEMLLPFVPPEIRALPFDADDGEEITTLVRYAGYVERELGRQQQAEKLEHQKFPEQLDFAEVSGLSREALERLQQAKPQTLGQAARVPGVTPAAVQVLSFWLAGRRRTRNLPSRA